jgi:hypothetical protein
MKTVETWQKVAFVGTLAAIAFLINGSITVRKARLLQRDEQVHIEQQNRLQAKAAAEETKVQKQREADEAKAKQAQAEQEAAERFQKFLRQYVNAGFSRKPGRKTLAMATASDRGNFNQAVSREIIRRFGNDGAEIYSSFFTPKFYTDGLFSAAFSGSSQVASDLRLSESVDGLLLALTQVTYSTNASLDNLITANVRLDVRAAPVSGNGQSQSWGFTANGAGFHTTDALLMAEERLIKQISADTKMSLSEITQLNQTQ